MDGSQLKEWIVQIYIHVWCINIGINVYAVNDNDEIIDILEEYMDREIIT